MTQTLSDELLKEHLTQRLPVSLPEVKIMLKIIRCIGWINLLIGLPSVLLVLNMRSLSLIFTGLLSLLTYRLLNMIIKHVYQTKSWAEVGVIIMCGVYFPSCVMWVCLNNLMEAILR